MRIAAGILFLLAIPWADTRAEEGFVSLFNGKDLTGWVNVNTYPDTWGFNEEGYLTCTGKPIGEIRTERMYQNFILELEWRHLVPKGNAGVFVWADDITARGQPFIRGVEVQILENAYGDNKSHTCHGDIFPIHGATMIPINGRGGKRAFPTENRSNPSPEWNHYRIECNEGNISLAVNGKVVTKGTFAIPSKGYICLESEGGVVHYRNVRIKELPDTPIVDDHVAIANRGYRNLYFDLSQWVPGPGWNFTDWYIAKENNGEARLLTTKEFFEDVEFIFDLRPLPDTGKIYFSPRGPGSNGFDLGPENVELAEYLENTGDWNRFEGKLEGDTLHLSVNGHALPPEKLIHLPRGNEKPADLLPKGPPAPFSGPFQFSTPGAVEIANVYVRELTKSE